MSTAEQLKEDLQYVKGAVQRQGRGHMPRGIALIWATYILVGFATLDIRPDWGALFLLLGGPVAYLISARLGATAALTAGISDRSSVRRALLHWGSLFFGIAALLVLSAEGRFSGQTMGQIILIMAGLVYFLGGVHLQVRLFTWLGPLMIIGAAAITYIDQWGWTVLGVLIAAGILASSFVGRKHG